MQEQPQDTQAKPVVACSRCREQKLKCDRSLPDCQRCRKQKAVCMYPPPPDRKQIARRTRQKKLQSGSKEHEEPSASSVPSTNATKRRRDSSEGPRRFDCLAEPESADLPSTEIGLLLQEVFFKRVYIANLLFHKTIAFQVFMLGKMPGYVQRAIFALASIFLQEVNSPYQDHIKALPMQTLYERSWSWAHAASVEVFSHIDEPSVMKIQTLQVLHLYYFSRGEIVRSKIHMSLAHQLSRLLAYDKLSEPGDDPPNRSLQFDREIRRRSFWASWCSMCLGSEDFTSSQLCENAANLPLPAQFGERGSIQGVDLTIGSQLDSNWEISTENGKSNSLMAELVRILGIWTKTRSWVSHSRNFPQSQRLVELVSLDRLFEGIELSACVPVTDLSASAQSCGESPELMVSLCSIYHLSRLLIPAFEVMVIEDHPLLVLGSAEASTSICTRVVYDHAMSYTRLLQQLFANNLDVTRLWPFAGLASFFVGHILLTMHTAMLGTTDFTGGLINIPGPDSEEMKVHQTVLGILSIYWKPLQTLEIALNEAISASRSTDGRPSTRSTFPWAYVDFLSKGEPSSCSSNKHIE